MLFRSNRFVFAVLAVNLALMLAVILLYQNDIARYAVLGLYLLLLALLANKYKATIVGLFRSQKPAA